MLKCHNRKFSLTVQQGELTERTSFIDGVDGVHTARAQPESLEFPEALRRVQPVCGRTLLDADPAIRVCGLSHRGADIHADGRHRQRWISAQVRRARHHARRVQLRLLQQRREEISQAQQGSLLRGRIHFLTLTCTSVPSFVSVCATLTLADYSRRIVVRLQYVWVTGICRTRQ